MEICPMSEQDRGYLSQSLAHSQVQRGLLGQQSGHVDVCAELVNEHAHQMEVP